MDVNDVVEDGAVNVLSQPILVPLDGTDVASGILPYVSQIAKRANVPLVLLTAVDPDAIDYPASAMSAVPASAGESMVIYRLQFEESSRVHAQDALHRVAARLRNGGIKAKSIATIGGPAEEILRVSEEEGCGLIAMSTHGRNPIGRSILGSVTDRVIHASNIPVLTVTPERAKKYQEEGAPLTTIVVPLDGSELAQRALPYVERLAHILSMEVLLARVVRTEHPTYTETDLGLQGSRIHGGSEPGSHRISGTGCATSQRQAIGSPDSGADRVGGPGSPELGTRDAPKPHRDDHPRTYRALEMDDGQCGIDPGEAFRSPGAGHPSPVLNAVLPSGLPARPRLPVAAPGAAEVLMFARQSPGCGHRRPGVSCGLTHLSACCFLRQRGAPEDR